MGKFHLTEAGVPAPCKARVRACPRGGEGEHFISRKEAQEIYELHQQMELDRHSVKPKSSLTTDRALASPLTYEGKEPRWFKKIPTVLSEKTFGTKPELIDVIDSPAGKLAVVWEPNSVEPNDIWSQVERGYSISRLSYRSLKTGEILGYLKSAYIDQEGLARCYGTDEWRGMRFEADSHSNRSMITEYPPDRKYTVGDESLGLRVFHPPFGEDTPPDELLAAKEKFWISAHSGMRIRPASGHFYSEWGTGHKTLPDEATLDSDIAAVKRVAIARMELEASGYSTPYIDYAKVEEPLRGKGMGHAMYVYSARKLAEKGLRLRSSGLQSPEAKKSWLLMASDERFPIHVENFAYHNADHRSVAVNYVMDFTK